MTVGRKSGGQQLAEHISIFYDDARDDVVQELYQGWLVAIETTECIVPGKTTAVDRHSWSRRQRDVASGLSLNTTSASA